MKHDMMAIMYRFFDGFGFGCVFVCYGEVSPVLR